jgi:hypothetical protein
MRACRAGGAAIEPALRSLDRSSFAVLFRDGVCILREEPMEDERALTEGAAQRSAQISLEDNPTPEDLARREERAAAFRRGWQRFQQDDPLHADPCYRPGFFVSASRP